MAWVVLFVSGVMDVTRTMDLNPVIARPAGWCWFVYSASPAHTASKLCVWKTHSERGKNSTNPEILRGFTSMNPSVNIHCSNHNNWEKKRKKRTIQDENSVIFAGCREDGHKARGAEFIQHPQGLEGSLVPGDHGVNTGLPFLTLGHTNPTFDTFTPWSTFLSMCCLTLTYSSIFHTELEQEMCFSRLGMQDCPALAARGWHCCSLCGAATHSTPLLFPSFYFFSIPHMARNWSKYSLT